MSKLHNKGSDTHFNISIISKEFEGLSAVHRHQKVFKILENELENGLHSVSLKCLDPSQVDGDDDCMPKIVPCISRTKQ